MRSDRIGSDRIVSYRIVSSSFATMDNSVIFGCGSSWTLRAFLFRSLSRPSFSSPAVPPFSSVPLCHTTIRRLICGVNVGMNVQECAIRGHLASRLAVDRCDVRSCLTYRWQQIQQQAALYANTVTGRVVVIGNTGPSDQYSLNNVKPIMPVKW
jgi:hypothetical protein